MSSGGSQLVGVCPHMVTLLGTTWLSGLTHSGTRKYWRTHIVLPRPHISECSHGLSNPDTGNTTLRNALPFFDVDGTAQRVTDLLPCRGGCLMEISLDVQTPLESDQALCGASPIRLWQRKDARRLCEKALRSEVPRYPRTDDREQTYRLF